MIGTQLQRVALASLLAMSISAVAQTTPAAKKAGPNKAPAAATAAATPQSPVVGMRTAHELIRYGDQNKDPHALITAARMLQNIGSSEFRGERAGGTAGTAKTADDTRSVAALLQRAKAMADNRPDIVAAADAVAQMGTRGAIVGPKRGSSVVNTRTTDVYRVTFRGEERAVVLVSGDGDSDLDLYIYDDRGNLICKDDDRTDDMVCGWTPRYTGSFRIEIKNLGVANQYVIAHN